MRYSESREKEGERGNSRGDEGGNVERVEGLRAATVRSRRREDGERRRGDRVGERARESERGAAQAEVDGQERFNLLSLSTSACARSLIRLFARFVQATASAQRTKIGNAAVFSLSRERVQRRRRAARERNLPNPPPVRLLGCGGGQGVNATFRVMPLDPAAPPGIRGGWSVYIR